MGIEAIIAEIGLEPGPALEAARQYVAELLKEGEINARDIEMILHTFYDGYAAALKTK